MRWRLRDTGLVSCGIHLLVSGLRPSWALCDWEGLDFGEGGYLPQYTDCPVSCNTWRRSISLSPAVDS